MISLALGVGAALAAACCGPTGGDVPTVLARREQWSVAVTLAEATGTGRWTDEGAHVSTSDRWAQGTWTLAGGLRLSPALSLGLGVPLVGSGRQAGALRGAGAGLGDLAASLRIEPWDPTMGLVPVFHVGAVAPTGRDWEHAEDPLLADVTGSGAWQGLAAVGLERSGEVWPWHATLWSRVGQGDTTRIEATVGAGRRVGEAWTFTGAAMATVGLTTPSRRTGADLGLIWTPRPGARLWGSVGGDLPLSGLGRDLPTEARVLFGLRGGR